MEKYNPVIETILSRRSVRHYQPGKPATRAELELLVRAGMAAPSAHNSQPWEFIIVDDPARTRELAKTHPYAGYLADAGSAIVVCGNLERVLKGTEDYWLEDCGAATQNILLAAASLGLGTVWCGIYPNRPVVASLRPLLGVPGQVVPFALIVVGHPVAGADGPKDKFNPERIHYQQW